MYKRQGIDRENRFEPSEPSDDAWRQELPPIIGNAAPFTSRMEVTAPSEYTVNAVGHFLEWTHAQWLRK